MVVKVALLIATCLAALTSAKGAEVEKVKKIRVEPSIGHFGYLPFNKWLFGESAHAHYTTCDNYQLSQYNVERTCEVMLHSIDNKGVSTNRTCEVKFQPNERAAEKFLPTVLPGDRVLLPHVYFTRRNERNFPTEMYLKYRVLNMDSCEYHDNRMLINPDFVIRNNLLYFHNNIVAHENSVGVFVPNDGLCYGAMCKLDFDARGQKIGNPASYLPEEMTGNFVQLFPTSTPNSYFALALEWKKRRADGKRPYADSVQLLYASEGKSVELMKFSYKAGHTELFADYSNGLFAVCRKYSSAKGNAAPRTIRCAQFDENNNRRRTMMDTAFNLGNATRPIAVYNAPGGGILLISGKCGHHKSDENLCRNLIFEQFRASGGKGKVRHIHECEYNVPLAAFAKDGENGQLCVSLYNSCDNNRFEVFFSKKCYAKKLFF